MGNKINIDRLIHNRGLYMAAKNYQQTDEIRDLLDTQLVFIFDHKDGFQETHYLPQSYFKSMAKIERIRNTKFKNKRQFVEFRLREDRQAEKLFDNWLDITMLQNG